MLEMHASEGLPIPIPRMGWWAVYTRHQHEKIIAEMLAAKGLEVFLPLYVSVHRWKDRKKSLELPLFPCYLFIRESIGGRLLTVSTPGIHMLLTLGERIAVIPDEEIAAIRKAVTFPTRVEPHPFLNCGERVRVVRGPMEGHEGILIRKKNQCRLVLSVHMLSQAASVEVSALDVERAALPSKPPLPCRPQILSAQSARS